jgi:hypothetical protein
MKYTIIKVKNVVFLFFLKVGLITTQSTKLFDIYIYIYTNIDYF